jgi:ribosomal protein L11 methyltransferase
VSGDPTAARLSDHRWWRLEMAAPPELEESLLWKLQNMGISRVAVRHHPSTPDQHQLVAWLPAIDWPQGERARLPEALAPLAATFALPLPPLAWALQDDEDWGLSWKQHWQPDPVGERLLILPAWLEVPDDQAHRLVIRIDPGSAFGTGSHPTTRLCLEALGELAQQAGGALTGRRVADLGCGSGILGFGALRLGAAALAATDNDPLAVRATRENGLLNGFRAGPDGPLQLALGSVEGLAELLAGQPADILLCNILAPVIAELAVGFKAVLAPGGVGFLSGLLVDQAPALDRTLASLGWTAELIADEGGWGLMRIWQQRHVI